MPIPRVIDLSHHNTIPEDLLETKEAGVIAIVHKLTEGSSYVDNKAQARFYLAHQAGMAWGLYHFLRPGDMVQQAHFFIDTAVRLGIIDENTMLAADHEDQKVSGEDLKEFLDEVEDLTGRSPVVYSGHVIKEQLEGTGYRPKRRLWLAQYSSKPELPDGVTDYWLWQYTDDGEVPGVVPPTDLNHFEGTDAEFLKTWAGTLVVPEPEPDDDAPQVEVVLSADRPVIVTVVLGENVMLKQEE